MNRAAGRRNCDARSRKVFRALRTTPLRRRRWLTGDDTYNSRLDSGSDSGRIKKAKVRFASAMAMAITKSVRVVVPAEVCNMRPFS